MVVVQFMMTIGVTCTNPLLPLFLEKDLGLVRGRQLELWTGLIASAHFLTLTVFLPIWGRLADRHGRKMLVIRSSAAVGAFSLLSAVVTNHWQLLGVRLGMGVLSGFPAAAVALVGSVAPKERIGYALGLLGTAQTVGLVFGPVIGGLLSTRFGYRVIFLTTGVLSLAACLLAAALVREKFAPPAPGEVKARRGIFREIASVASSRDLVPMFVCLALTQVAVNGIGPVTTLFVGELDVAEKLVPTVAGLAYSVAGVGAAVTAPLLGRLADRSGYRTVLLSCLAGAAVFYLPQAAVRSAWQLLALRFVLGLCVGGIQPAAYALIGRLAPRAQQSSAYGLTFSATSLGNFSGPILSGFVAAGLGIRWVFVYTGILVALNALWVAAKVKEVREPGAGRAAAG